MVLATKTMKRLSASIPDKLYERLEALAADEGRSVSNLVSYLLEHSLDLKLQGYKRADGQKHSD
jgi:predicted DNA-binding protein